LADYGPVKPTIDQLCHILQIINSYKPFIQSQRNQQGLQVRRQRFRCKTQRREQPGLQGIVMVLQFM